MAADIFQSRGSDHEVVVGDARAGNRPGGELPVFRQVPRLPKSGESRKTAEGRTLRQKY